MTEGTRWAPGSAYGPVLSQTDLYLLCPKLEIHPILTHNYKDFHLNFNLATGRAVGYNPESQDRDLDFIAKDEAATLPRVTELFVITKHSPWCTIVKNPTGVSLGNMCAAIWKDYAEHPISEDEVAALAPAMQDRVRRTAMSRLHAGTGTRYMGAYADPAYTSHCKRIDLLRENVFFDGLEHDDEFAKNRLGFAAPNIVVMHLTS